MKFMVPNHPVPAGMSVASAIRIEALALSRAVGESSHLLEGLLHLQQTYDTGARLSPRYVELFALPLSRKFRALERISSYAHNNKMLDTSEINISLGGSNYIERLVNLRLLEMQVIGRFSEMLTQNKVDSDDLNRLCSILILESQELGINKIPLLQDDREQPAEKESGGDE